MVRISEAPMELEAEFERLAEEWRRESLPLGTATAKAMLPSYQRIIGLGSRALPFILRELQAKPDHWFWALKAISGDDPVPAEKRGRIGEMAECWLRWGRERGHV